MCLSHYLPFYGIVYPTKYPPWVSIRHVGSHPSILSTSHGPVIHRASPSQGSKSLAPAPARRSGDGMDGVSGPKLWRRKHGGHKIKVENGAQSDWQAFGVAIWDETLVAMEILVCGKSGLSFVIQAVDLYHLISPLKNEPRYSQQGLKKVLLPAEKSSNTIEPIWYHLMLRETTAKFSQKVV